MNEIVPRPSYFWPAVAACLVAMATSILALWFFSNDPAQFSAGEHGTQPEQNDNAASKPDSAVLEAKPAVESAQITRLRKRIENLKSALRALTAERESAEAALQQSERDITELERFIDEIKARGEDPAEYADEGLAMFQPAFQAYQNAFDKLEMVESMEQTATEELAAAEDELRSMLVSTDEGH